MSKNALKSENVCPGKSKENPCFFWFGIVSVFFVKSIYKNKA